MPVDRLSALDEAFLRLESRSAHLHIGWTLMFEAAPPSCDEFRAHIASRLELLPRFRRRVVTSRWHDPVWVDDSEFELTRHVERVRVPEPGGLAEVRQLTGRLLSRPLDLDRPLWRLYLLDGLRDGGFAIVGQAHHALVDGMAALEVTQLLLDDGRSRAGTSLADWLPAPEPSVAERLLAGARERLGLARSIASFAPRVLLDPLLVGESMIVAGEVAATLAAVGLSSAPRTSFNRRVGRQRTVAYAEVPLDGAKEIGRIAGATVNDVILAITGVALGRHLRRAGANHRSLRALVPVNTRASAADAGELGNRISFVLADLPVGEPDPSAVLDRVRLQMREYKRSDRAEALDAVLRAAAAAPVTLRDAIARLVTRPETFNLVVSNVPGPRQPLYLLGRRLRAAYPAVPLIDDHGLSVGVLSYNGVIHVGLHACPALVPNLVELAWEFERAFGALSVEVGGRPGGGARLNRRWLDERVLV
jgi:WS/DGAT/MGAT family acyltransferase